MFHLLAMLVCSAMLIGLTSAHSAEVSYKLAGYGENLDAYFFIKLTGNIEPGDTDKLAAALGGTEVQRGQAIYIELDSKGGSFEEALKIARFALDKSLSTRLTANSECLSACSIIFMAGTMITTVGATLERRMHRTATLGFHAPTLDIGSSQNSAAEMAEAYDEAVEGIGSKLLAIARFRGRQWNNSLIRSDLVNEMMLRRGDNFYFVDTVRKAVVNEITIDDAGGPGPSEDTAKDACANFLALHTADQVSNDTWYGPIKKKQDGDYTTYEVPLSRGQCLVGPGSVSVSEVNEEKGTQYYAEDWGYWPGDKKLRSLPSKPTESAPLASAPTAALPTPEPEIAPPPPEPPFVPSLGYSWGQRSRGAGESRALKECKGSCRIALWFHNTCGAIAVGDNAGWGTAWHGRGGQAGRLALKQCQQHTTGCSIKQTVCSPRGHGAIAIEENR